MERTIFHIDMNSCYASIESLFRPELRNVPMAVGGDEQARHGIILAKNELAKKYGVRTGEALWQARQKCPGITIVPPHYDRYVEFSRRAREIYGEYTDLIEPFGIDEVWADVSGSVRLESGTAGTLANEIRLRIKRELGITVSVGASYNKIFAKLGSDYKKPDAVTVFTRENYRCRVWPLPCAELLFVGHATEERLSHYGIHTIGQIAQTPPRLLKSWLGKQGMTLHLYANGQDMSPVSRLGEEAVVKSVSNSTTTPRDMENTADASVALHGLCDSVARRLRENRLIAKTVQLSMRDTSLNVTERQKTLAMPTHLAPEIYDAAMELLCAHYDWKKPLRSIGVMAGNLAPEDTPVQLSLFDDAEKRSRREKLAAVSDDICRMYGGRALCTAAALSDPTLIYAGTAKEREIQKIGGFQRS